MHPHIITLDNGLRVIFVDTKAFPTVTTLLLIGAGSRYENEKNNGIAHFLEHMFYKGSKKFPNPYIISSTIEGLGGAWNAFTSKDYTGYYIKATTSHFEEMIDLLSDILLRPLFENKEIEKEKGVIVEEINMYEDQPQSKVGDLFENLTYKGTTLGYDVTGTKDTVVKFDRSTFTNYIGQLYFPNNAVLVVAGGLSQIQNSKFRIQNYEEIIREKFGDWKRGKAEKFSMVNEQQTKPNILVFNKKTEQAHFCLGFRTFGLHDKRRHALSVLTTILGGGASSRLFSEVREKHGLCYYISTGRQTYHEVGNMVTQAGVTKEVDKVKKAVEAALKEHKKIKLGDIKKEELTRVKEMIKGRTLLSMEDSFNVAYYYGKKKLLENSIEEPQSVLDEIEKVTVDDLVELTKELFVNDRLNFALIGPFESKDNFSSVISIK